MRILKITTDLTAGKYWETEPLPMAENADGTHAICLYPEMTAQTFEGFGAALTEASAVCRKSLTPKNREMVMQDCYGPNGLRYSLARTHMGSCDFSLGNYTAARQDSSDRNFMRDDENLIPMIQAAQYAAGRTIGLMLSPWSPPAWMKTNHEMNHGGKLLPCWAMRYAELLADYALHYREAGLTVRMLSIQNEPEAAQTWDSCIFSAEEEGAFAVKYLRPALDAVGLPDVKILCWDHNKEALLRRAAKTFSVPGARQAIDGMAVHWYTGDHFEALALTQRLFPEKPIYFSEGCLEYRRFRNVKDLEKAEVYAHDIIGNLNAGVVGSIDWNLLLDKNGGPNHVGNYCEAPVMSDGRGGYRKQGSYWYIGQFSRYISPQAKRIETSRWCTELEVTAFRNTDGSMAIVLLNRSSKNLPACLLQNGENPFVTLTVQAHTIVTLMLYE